MSHNQDMAHEAMHRDVGLLINQGRVYSAFVANESVASGEDLTAVLSIGDAPAAILGLNLTANDNIIDFAVHRDPIYTGGTELPRLNLNDIVGITGDENVDVVNSSIVVTDKGTPVFGPWNLYSENNITITRSIEGPLVLRPSTDYLISMNNPSGSPVEMSLAIRYVDA